MHSLIRRVIRVSQILTYKTFNTRNVKLRTFGARAVPFVTEFMITQDYSLDSVEHMASQVAVCETATLMFQLATILYNVSVLKQ